MTVKSKNSKNLRIELEQLSRSDDFRTIHNIDQLPEGEQETARLVNQILHNYKLSTGKRETLNLLASLKSILNGLDAIILVTVPETGEIIFLNDRCKEFNNVKGDGVGKYCYEFLVGNKERCVGCPSKQFKEDPDKIVQWDAVNFVENRTCRMTSMLIDWPTGEKVRLEFGVEITDSKRQGILLENILNGIDALICVIDPDTNIILFLNDSIKKNFNITGDDGIGQLCHKFLQGRDEPCPSCPYLELRANPDKVVIWEHKESINGSLLLKTARMIDWTNGRKAHLEYAIDITELRNMEKNIMKLESEVKKLYYDPLTEIYSRRYFEENIGTLLSSQAKNTGTLSLMMIDIDYFKNYNDTYGHIKGDDCLKIIAEILKNCITKKDDFVARYGGEEFVVALPDTNEHDARLMAVKMLDSIQNRNIPHEKSEAADCVTVSIGVVTGHVNMNTTYIRKDFLKCADEMLYKSKQGGRNRYTFTAL